MPNTDFEPVSRIPQRTGFGGHDGVTLIAGSSFLICNATGDIEPGGLDGYYAFDTRMLSQTQLRIDGERPRMLSSAQASSRRLTVMFTVGDPTTPSTLVIRTLTLSDELVENIELVNLTDKEIACEIFAVFRADFADVFDLRRGTTSMRGYQGSGPAGDRLLLRMTHDDVLRQVHVVADEVISVGHDEIHLGLTVPGRDRRATRLRVTAECDESGTPRRPFVLGSPRLEIWTVQTPNFRADDRRLDSIWRRSSEDIGALRLWNENDPAHVALAAGVPWFMTLFGRDSLIAGMMSLLLKPELLLGSLFALAQHQGHRVDSRTGEEPGKILHEVRAGAVARGHTGWGEVYYGTIDATPLFVMAAAESWRWGAPRSEIMALLPACEAATKHVVSKLNSGPGLLSYPYAKQGGLANQGWKDSFDGVRYADGRIAEGDIALVEVQGYARAALLAMAELRESFGTGDSAPLRRQAEDIATLIEELFWMPDMGYYATALADGGAVVDSITTNPAHLLWVMPVCPGRAESVARVLATPEVSSGFGLRTLSADNPAYNPLSYHCGSVWPHDTAIAVAGLLSAGQIGPAHDLIGDLFDALDAFGGRAPELFGGFARTDFAAPVPYPTTCSPQAWAAAAPIHLVRALLGLQPDVPGGKVVFRPRIPPGITIEMEGVKMGDSRISFRATGGSLEVLGNPPDLDIVVT
ncbi:MAG: amylo-alpha-1,6-glucosidase [Actinobacteria bacterium ATB1]|nr:amylo-alpha-1,6-glucosidase [Actinobacteria bacterium ATB1]